MSVAVGSRLGPYEVVSLLGSGGMGDVYKARDTRLGRSVAIKLLRPHAAEDPEQRRRFEQEARAVSHLSHPGIATVFDIGRHDHRDFIVMEFVDGETLADRIRRGPLPVGAALRIAIDVAEALGHAHRAGITHRDLKPANIILSRSGPKLLDFGLAKLRNQAAEATRSLDRAVAALDAPVRQSTTLHTQHGTILGTFEYMAPEQVESADVDPRADVFAFGALLYEMITGRRAFEAATPASLIGAILVADPPPLGANRPDVPPLLDLTVRRCLAKDREDRWQSVSDLLFMLRSIAAGPAMQQSSTRSRARTVELGLAVSVLALVVVLSLLWTGDAAISRSTTLWDLALPVGHSLTAELSPSLAISPNGQQIVYGARSGVASQLFVRRADEFEPTPLAGSSDGHTPFFSPDGQWVGFMAKGRILKVPLTGGAPQLVCDAPSLAPGSPGATWGPDNTIVFASGVAGLMRVNAAGGSPELLTTPASDRGEVTHISPQFLPGGQELLFTIRTGDDGWRVAILTIGTRQWRLLPSIGEVAGARYAATGHLIYAQSGNLFARPMSIAETSFAGTALPLSADVYTRVVTDALIAQFALSDNGALAFISGQPPDWTLMAVDRAGRELALLADTPKVYRYPRFSPDGHRIAVTVEELRTDIWIVNEPGSIRKLTKSGSNTLPVWTPKGDRVTFASRRPGSDGIDIYSTPVDDSSEPEQVVTGPGVQAPSGWSPDGSALAYYEVGNNTARDIWVWSQRDGRRTRVLVTPANERVATFSPDGAWIAYVSNDSGQDEVYVQRYPGPGPREIVSQGGGTEPVWAPNSREVFYRNKGQLMAVTFRTAPALVADPPRVLFPDRWVLAPSETGRPNYDIAPDGLSFVMVRTVERSPTHLHVVENWPDRLAGGTKASNVTTSKPAFAAWLRVGTNASFGPHGWRR